MKAFFEVPNFRSSAVRRVVGIAAVAGAAAGVNVLAAACGDAKPIQGQVVSHVYVPAYTTTTEVQVQTGTNCTPETEEEPMPGGGQMPEEEQVCTPVYAEEPEPQTVPAFYSITINDCDGPNDANCNLVTLPVTQAQYLMYQPGLWYPTLSSPAS